MLHNEYLFAKSASIQPRRSPPKFAIKIAASKTFVQRESIFAETYAFSELATGKVGELQEILEETLMNLNTMNAMRHSIPSTGLSVLINIRFF